MMSLFHVSTQIAELGGCIGLVLVLASMVGLALKSRLKSVEGEELASNFNSRVKAWWAMVLIFFLAVAFGRYGAVILFALVSFLALREYVTLTPTSPADHRALFWSFFVITPLQYILVALGNYGMEIIFIPVYAYLFVPIRNVLAGDCNDFLARSAKIQWGLMICVYFVSYAPALFQFHKPFHNDVGAGLLCFLICVAEISDVLQYVFGKSFGRRKIAPVVSPNKTVEGFACGVAGAVVVGMALYWITPFKPWQAALMALAIALMGFFGGLVMSAIKRDRGVKDFGASIPGHGGILDRIDSLCFAAPIFFHLTRFFFFNPHQPG